MRKEQNASIYLARKNDYKLPQHKICVPSIKVQCGFYLGDITVGKHKLWRTFVVAR